MALEIKTVESDPALEADYRGVIDCSPDSTALHTLEWRNILKDTLRDTSAYFVCYDGPDPAGVLPTFTRTTGLGSVMNSLAFSGSYGGACISKHAGDKTAVLKKLLSHAIDYARASGCLTATFIMSPFSYGYKNSYIDILKPDFIYDRFTQVSCLSEPLKPKPSVRNHVSKAERLGVRLDTELTDSNLARFYEIYCSNMRHLGLESKPLSFFQSLVKNMASTGLARFRFAMAGDEMVSGLLTLNYGNGVMSHETVFDRKHSRFQGNSFLLDIALRDAMNEGYSYFNWGASENRESGVYKFKAAWGAGEMPYHYFTCKLSDCSSLSVAGPAGILGAFSRFYFVIPFSAI
ncbi:MAG TPA: GNAT family N-acetyltransferase [bacterium]|nr:GNAT family N-acetyltransferase [bacterium]